MIERLILQENTTVLNLYVHIPNNTLSNYMMQKLMELQKEINESTVIVGDFNTPLLAGRKSVRTEVNSTTLLIN